MTDSIQIVGTGARTPLGLGAAPSAAAYRAGLSGMKEHPFMVDHAGEAMLGAFDVQLDPSLAGLERMQQLVQTALLEASEPLSPARSYDFRLPLFLGLPEIRPGFTEGDAESLRSWLAHVQELPFAISHVETFTQGHAAGLAALAAGTEAIQQGKFEMCIIGGVDTYFQPDTIEWLDKNRQLIGADARSAFVPGEGAAFSLLMTESVRMRLGLTALGRVLRVAIGKEAKLIKTSDVCLGTGLSGAVQNAVANLSPFQTIDTVICDINSERYRSEEWGFVCLRLPAYFDDPTTFLSPADAWGDMGAASGVLFIMLACQAAVRGYANGPRTLLWASSEGGLRGAAVLGFDSSLKRRTSNHV